MELSIIITTYKNPELLKVCIDSIKKNITLTDYEMIVGDSEAEERTGLIIKEDYPEIKYIPFEKNVGLQALVRATYKETTGDYIIILNGDIIVKKNAIENLLNYAKNHPETGMIGPKLLNFNETLQYSCYRFYRPITILYRRTFLGKMKFAQKHLDHFLMKDYDHKETRAVDWFMGAAYIVSRKAVEKVGLMDQRFKLYFEDIDWCRRFWINNYKVIYLPSSEMYHYHGKGSDSSRGIIKSLVSNKLAWIHIISAIKYFLKYWREPFPKHD